MLSVCGLVVVLKQFGDIFRFDFGGGQFRNLFDIDFLVFFRMLFFLDKFFFISFIYRKSFYKLILWMGLFINI